MTPWSELVQKDLAQVKVASFGKVGVLLGGKSGEREISLMSGKGVLEALLSKGVNAHAFDPAKQSIADLAK
ncbi:MAG: D-alanine--D-alanine ligase, partial [Polynucleobacter victoriensis]